jgi:hypothetical protein
MGSIEVNSMVVSVPHSGTRTLVQQLGLPTHQHFGNNEAKFTTHAEVIHIPIRNPLDVAKSWALRNKGINNLLGAYEHMFDFISGHSPVLHKVELLPRLAGTEDNLSATPQAVDDYQRIVTDVVIKKHQEFFDQFYPRQSS